MRTKALRIRVTSSEHRAVHTAARREGMSVSDLVRKMLRVLYITVPDVTRSRDRTVT